MPHLDSQVQKVLDSLAAGAFNTGAVPRDMSDEERRRRVDSDPLFVRDVPPVGEVHDLVVPGPAGPIPVRAYVPPGTGEPFPVAVYFHGGGFHSGSIEMYDATCRDLCARSGTAVVSVGYRLAPEHPFPVPVEDCYAATAWVAEHAAQFRADGTRLAVIGPSAGGNLAAAVALMARDRGGPAIALQVLIYPVTASDPTTGSMTEFAEGYWLTRDTTQFCWESYLPDPADRRHPYAAVLYAPDLSGLPPAVVLTAECDPLRDEGERYAHRLAEAGVPTRLTRYFGVIHGFLLMAGVIDRGREAMADVAAALADALASPASQAARLERERNRETVRRYFVDGLATGDLDLGDQLHTEDYVWHSPGGRDLDRAATSRFVRKLFERHADMAIEVHDILVDGDRVAVRFTQTGRQVARWNGVEGTGQLLDLRGLLVSRMVDGQIAETWELVLPADGGPWTRPATDG